MINTIQYKKGMELKTNNLYSGDDGVYRYINNQLYEAVSKVEQVFSGDKIDEELLAIKLPKMPKELFLKIREFFKKIYNKYGSEVAILLWYNFNTDKWEIEVPKQEVTTASVNYKRDEKLSNDLITKGYLCVGTIHSHGTMSAFHSGTDDDDEYQFDGLHITIGKVLSGFEYAQRFIIKNVAYKIESITEVIDIQEEEIEVPKKWFKQVKKTKTNSYVNRYKGSKVTKSDYSKLIEHYNTDLLKYECPVCNKTFSSDKMKDEFNCPNCNFPMNENEDDYLLETVKGKKTAVFYGTPDYKEDKDYDQRILEEYNNNYYLRGNY